MLYLFFNLQAWGFWGDRSSGATQNNIVRVGTIVVFFLGFWEGGGGGGFGCNSGNTLHEFKKKRYKL